MQFYSFREMKVFKIVLIYSGLLWSMFGYSQHGVPKINGISYIGSSSNNASFQTFKELSKTNSNYVAFTPEIVMDRSSLTFENYEMYFDLKGPFIKSIRLAQDAGLKILFKPHILLNAIPKTEIDYASALALYGKSEISNLIIDKTRAAEWRGDFEPLTEEDWKYWNAQYEALMIRSAKLASELRIDQLCIGSELRRIAILQPKFWRSLIQKVRQEFNGELLYSANWDEYEKITFWDELDYIGIDAYFPITEERFAKVKTALKNWYPIRRQLKKIANQYNKTIVFTEYGYRNIEYAGKRPWEHDKGLDSLHNESQQNLYRAFYESFWSKEWVAGGYAWRWHADGPKHRDTNFTVQGKPAFQTMQIWYKGF